MAHLAALGVSDDQGKTMTAHLTPERRLDRLKDLVELRGVEQDVRTDVLRFVREARTALKTRNDTLHSLWIDVGKGPMRIRWRVQEGEAGKELHLEFGKTWPGQLETIADSHRAASATG